MVFLPCGKLVAIYLRNNFIRVTNCLYDLHAFFKANNRSLSLIFPYQFVRADRNNQMIALLFRFFENVQMADMEKVKYAV